VRTIIAGGRNYFLTDFDEARLDGLNVTEVVCGCARGADTGGEQWAQKRGIPVKRFPADWDRLGRGAGLVRNEQMADYAEALVAFPGGRGTDHMVRTVLARRLAVWDWRDREALF
jgi:hypothetical protein